MVSILQRLGQGFSLCQRRHGFLFYSDIRAHQADKKDHWQQFFPNQDKWLTTDRLGYEIIGYRDGGYRGITRKRNISPGEWRVDVETEEGVLLGRINFQIEEVGERVLLKTIYK